MTLFSLKLIFRLLVQFNTWELLYNARSLRSALARCVTFVFRLITADKWVWYACLYAEIHIHIIIYQSRTTTINLCRENGKSVKCFLLLYIFHMLFPVWLTHSLFFSMTKSVVGSFIFLLSPLTLPHGLFLPYTYPRNIVADAVNVCVYISAKSTIKI